MPSMLKEKAIRIPGASSLARPYELPAPSVSVEQSLEYANNIGEKFKQDFSQSIGFSCMPWMGSDTLVSPNLASTRCVGLQSSTCGGNQVGEG